MPKQHQPAMTIDEQIANLQSLGLIIKDKEYAKKVLNDISYFRLIKAYSLNLKTKNGKYHTGITFEHIVELYLFDAKLAKKPILYKEYSSNGIRNDRIFAVILCLKQLLKKDSHWSSFVTTLGTLIEKYDNIQISSMGFPENWENLLMAK